MSPKGSDRPGRPRKAVVRPVKTEAPRRRQNKTIKTPYGRVDRKVLEKLEDSFDTRQLLNAVAAVDGIGSRTGYDEESIRNELLMLHGMAHELINGGQNLGRTTDTPIWELADELSMEVFRWQRELEEVQGVLDRLAELAPEDEDDDE